MRPLDVPKPSITELWESYDGTVLGADRGGWQKATCVLHEDRSPSASINEEECRWRCFVCDESGDAIDLIMRKENARWLDARAIAQKLADGKGQEIRTERGRSSLLPQRTGNRTRGSHFSPPWTRL